jgi:hypothetical protein
MHNTLKVFTTAIFFLFSSIALAQYEQLVNDPDALKAVIDNGGFVTKAQ